VPRGGQEEVLKSSRYPNLSPLEQVLLSGGLKSSLHCGHATRYCVDKEVKPRQLHKMRERQRK
jgi:hypothetical protein